MAAWKTLADVFDRGLRDGITSLPPSEQELFLIQDFIVDREMGGLSGYVYNRLPNLTRIQAAVDAMRNHGLGELAAILAEAMELFRGYTEPDPPATWSRVLRQYDPGNRLGVLEAQLDSLDDYGLTGSDIA